MTIPRVVHYCWFGPLEKPPIVRRCIASWHEVLDGYQFVEWNERNFDVRGSRYVREAYESGMYAFVSDVARLCALRDHGGIYLDTDVAVYRPFDPVLGENCVLGFEEGNFVATSFLAAPPGHPLVAELLSQYEDAEFLDSRGARIRGTNVERLSLMLADRGFQLDDAYQARDDIEIYPMEYFSPYEYSLGLSRATERTYCEHLFSQSWGSWRKRAKKQTKYALVKVMGRDRSVRLFDLLRGR